MRKKMFVFLLVGLFVLSSTSLVYAFMPGGGGPDMSGGSGMPSGGSPSSPPSGGSPGMPDGSGMPSGGSPGMPDGSGMPSGGSPNMPGGSGMPSGGSPGMPGTPGQGLYPGGFTNPPPANAIFLDIPPAGAGSTQSLFGPETPPRMVDGQMFYGGSGSYPGGFSNPPPDNPEFLGIPPISPFTMPPGREGIFGSSNDFFNGGVVGMLDAPAGARFEITLPPANSGWVEEDGKWMPPLDWNPPEAWKAPEGWEPGKAITLEEAPWNYLAASAGKSYEGGYIPGTLVKLPENMTLGNAMTNFDPTALGITLPSFMAPADFQKILLGEAVAESMTQDMIKALNPGKFGPMSDPYIMSRASGLAMDGGGGFRAYEQKDAPGNQFILQADNFAKEGKFVEALNMMNDPAAPFGQFPDALIYAFKSDLSAKAKMMTGAMDNIEKALSLAPFNEVLYTKTEQLLKETGKTEKPNVYINGIKPGFDVEPFIESGRTMVPFRALAETMGSEVKYDADKRMVTMTKDKNEVNLTIGSTIAAVNGIKKTLDVPAQIVDGRTVIPLRFVSENLESKVEYLPDAKLVKILPKLD